MPMLNLDWHRARPENGCDARCLSYAGERECDDPAPPPTMRRRRRACCCCFDPAPPLPVLDARSVRLLLTAGDRMAGGACCGCGGRRQEPKKPRTRRGSEVTPVVEKRHPAAGAARSDPADALGSAPARRPAAGAASPVRVNRRKPRSFEAPATPKVAAVRKPRSFGAEGWLKVDLPADDVADQMWYRRVRNIVTAEHRGGSAAAGELAPLHGGLYVGDRADAQNTEQLRRLGVTHVLNCATASETATGAGFYRAAERTGAAADRPLEYLELGAADSEIADFVGPNLAVRATPCGLRAPV